MVAAADSMELDTEGQNTEVVVAESGERRFESKDGSFRVAGDTVALQSQPYSTDALDSRDSTRSDTVQRREWADCWWGKAKNIAVGKWTESVVVDSPGTTTAVVVQVGSRFLLRVIGRACFEITPINSRREIGLSSSV